MKSSAPMLQRCLDVKFLCAPRQRLELKQKHTAAFPVQTTWVSGHPLPVMPSCVALPAAPRHLPSCLSILHGVLLLLLRIATISLCWLLWTALRQCVAAARQVLRCSAGHAQVCPADSCSMCLRLNDISFAPANTCTRPGGGGVPGSVRALSALSLQLPDRCTVSGCRSCGMYCPT